MIGKIFCKTLLIIFLTVFTAQCACAQESSAGIINTFAFKTINTIAADNDDNFLFSPFSILSALGMLYAGSAGDTQCEIEKALLFNPAVHENLGALANDLAQHEILQSANRIWLDKTIKLKRGYNNILTENYKSIAGAVDFKNYPDDAKNNINDWISDHTNGKIQNLIQNIEPDTKMILTNAVYFMARWTKTFSTRRTALKKFSVPNSEAKDVQMMSQLDEFMYAEIDNNKIIKLPYDNFRTSMIVILPADDIKTLQENLTPEIFSDWIKKLTRYDVDLWLPKFKIERRYELKELFSALGITLAFTDKADFSGITADAELKADSIIHQTFIDVDEEKTEAAAATAIQMVGITAMPEQLPRAEFHADRPFLYFIIENDSHAILFAGRQTFKD